MKRILRLWGCYALIQKATKDFLCVQTLAQAPAHPGLGLAIGVLAFLLLISIGSNASGHRLPAAPADTLSTEITPLQIGDTIPESLWHLPLQVVNHPEGKDTITLNDYRHKKLLILEFWGFSCSGCIQSINKLDAIKASYSDDRFAFLPLHVLPYRFDENKMLDYVGKAIKRNTWSVPSVVKDTTLYMAFGSYLPDWGDVWILDGRLLAVPQHGYISRETISAVLKGDFIAFKNRRNVTPIDPYRPLLSCGNGEGNLLMNTGQSVVTGYLPHQYSMHFKIEYRNDSTYAYTWNRTLSELLYEAYKPDIMQHLTAKTGIVWMTDGILEGNLGYLVDTTLAPFERVAARLEWNTANRFGYQLLKPGKLSELEVRRRMQHDLASVAASHWGVSIEVEGGAKHRYAVLRTLNDKLEAQRLLTAGTDSSYTNHDDSTYRFIGYGKQTLVYNIDGALFRNPSLGLSITQVVDSTGIAPEYRSGFEFPSSFRDGTADLDAINAALANYGLYLTVEEKMVPVLVVRDKSSVRIYQRNTL